MLFIGHHAFGFKNPMRPVRKAAVLFRLPYSSKKAEKGIPSFTEDNAKTDFYLDKGEFLFDYFIEKGV